MPPATAVPGKGLSKALYRGLIPKRKPKGKKPGRLQEKAISFQK